MPSIVAFAFVLALSAPQDPPATTLPDVTVEAARPVEDRAKVFIDRVAAPPLRSGSLAVWVAPLCVTIENLRPDATRAVHDRIAVHARALGLTVEEPGCQPNIAIVATADGRATASSLVEENPALFRPSPWWPAQLGKAEERRFAESDAPVRWWTVSMPHDMDTGQRLMPLGQEGTVERHFFMSSRPPGGDEFQVMEWVIVVIDAEKTETTPAAALGDYVALVTLAEMNMGADTTGQPTVMNLFSDPQAVSGMTAWDSAYLRALYDSPRGWSNIRFNKDDIARRMAASTVASPAP